MSRSNRVFLSFEACFDYTQLVRRTGFGIRDFKRRMCEFRALRFEKTSLITVESLQKSLFIPKSLYFDKFLAEMTLDECETVDFYDFCIVFSRVVQPYLSKSMIDNIFQVINQSNTITFIFLYAYYKMCSYIFFIFSA